MQDGQRKQVVLLNEFQEKTRFYKFWTIESDICAIAEEFPNSHQMAFFACSRVILDHGAHSGGFPTK